MAIWHYILDSALHHIREEFVVKFRLYPTKIPDTRDYYLILISGAVVRDWFGIRFVIIFRGYQPVFFPPGAPTNPHLISSFCCFSSHDK